MKIIVLITFSLLQNPSIQQACQRRLMFDYGLNGLTQPSADLNPFCQTITQNCCDMNDLLKIFDDYNMISLPALNKFKDTFLQEIGRL